MSALWYPRAEFPRELDLCLTNACNLACRYCYGRGKKRSAPDWLTLPQIKKALDLYRARIEPGRVQKVSISGGEPFLDFRLLLGAVDAVRTRLGDRPKIEVFTNGTLLTRPRAAALLARRAELIVSCDGPRAVQDYNRRFWKRPAASTFAAVARNIMALTPEQRGALSAGATFSRETVGLMGPSARFLLSLGLRCVVVDLDIRRAWTGAEIESIRRSALELKRLHAATLRCGFGESQVRLRFDFITPAVELAQIANPPGLRELSLAPDGHFYPSGLVAAHGPGNERYRIGSLSDGLDQERMNAVLAEVRSYFSTHPRRGYNGCPGHVYFHCRLAGLDPKRLLGPGERLYRRLERVIGPVIDFELLLNRLGADRDIGDFGHLPKRNPRRGVERLAVRIRPGGLASARERADRLLYSPGDQKSLSLRTGNMSRDFRLVEAVSIYSLMKARVLGKKIKIAVAAPGRTVRPRHRLFLKEHGLAFSSGRGSAAGLRFFSALFASASRP
ncbi:MAG: radical SAM protein [Elusimicrobia bacterium]|nr:radical SAM protein [Elusimicrobiota bacterium]